MRLMICRNCCGGMFFAPHHFLGHNVAITSEWDQTWHRRTRGGYDRTVKTDYFETDAHEPPRISLVGKVMR
jgi:hypothetical protein